MNKEQVKNFENQIRLVVKTHIDLEKLRTEIGEMQTHYDLVLTELEKMVRKSNELKHQSFVTKFNDKFYQAYYDADAEALIFSEVAFITI